MTRLITISMVLALNIPLFGRGEQLADAVEMVVVNNSTNSYVARLRAARELGVRDVERNGKVLLAFLERGDPALNPQENAALRNEVVNVFIRTRRSPFELSKRLVQGWESEWSSPIWRDYCLQFLGEVVSEMEKEDRTAVENCLWKATESLNENYAGTALLSLRRLRNNPETRQRLAVTTVRILNDEGQNAGNKTIALQMATELGIPDALVFARNQLDSRAPLTLRMASLFTLGEMGEKDDISRIETYLVNPLAALRGPAKISHEKLTNKFYSE